MEYLKTNALEYKTDGVKVFYKGTYSWYASTKTVQEFMKKKRDLERAKNHKGKYSGNVSTYNKELTAQIYRLISKPCSSKLIAEKFCITRSRANQILNDLKDKGRASVYSHTKQGNLWIRANERLSTN